MTMTVTLYATQLQGTPVFFSDAGVPTLLKIFGAKVYPNDRKVYFPAFYPCHSVVLQDFKNLGIPVQLTSAAEQVVRYFDDFKKKLQMKELPVDFQFKTKPFEHQVEGLVHLLYNYRAALFYSCGLGKTWVVINWQRLTQCWPLILCPKVVLHVWAHEAKVHGVDQEYAIIDATSKTEKLTQITKAKDYSGAVITYDSARIYYEELIQLSYNAIVADESHSIKDITSKRTKAALILADKAARRIIMSGTPSLGNPLDMFPQLKFLTGALVPENYFKFKNMFCVLSPKNKHIVTGYRNLDLLQKRVGFIAIKKTKEECLDLPEQLIVDVPIELHRKQRNLYNAIVESKEWETSVEEVLQKHGNVSFSKSAGVFAIANAAVLVNKLIQIGCGFIYKALDTAGCPGCENLYQCIEEGIMPGMSACKEQTFQTTKPIEIFEENAKQEVLVQKLSEILVEPNNKCIIWGQYRPELDLIQDALVKMQTGRGKAELSVMSSSLPWSFVRIDGSNSQRIQQAAKTFNEDPHCRIYLGQVDTGVGITLNAANYMIYYSLPWKLVSYLQSLDRNHRVGQTRSVTVLRLIGTRTVDESVAGALLTKCTVSELITTVLLCGRCFRSTVCQVSGCKPFSVECEYNRTVARPITKVKYI